MFFLAAIIMIINAYLQQFKFESLSVSSLTWDPSALILVYLIGYHYFLFYWFQNYLNSIEKER